MEPNNDGRVVVVTGVGGMGLACAQRLGIGSTVVLADVNPVMLSKAAADLRAAGYAVVEQETDVSKVSSANELAKVASDLGRVETVVHTAGLSPVQATVDAILSVDLLGAALVLDVFGAVISQGGSGVFISSMAGTLALQEPSFERRLETTPTAELLSLPELSPERVSNAATAYGLAKRANQLRVRSGSLVWGRRGARVNSISPGIISTPMGLAELAGPNGDIMREMITASPMNRLGTAHDIAAAVEFLTGPHATFITGTDLLVDGGVVASILTSSD